MTDKTETPTEQPAKETRALTVAEQVRTILSTNAMQTELAAALGIHMKPEHMIRVAITSIQKTPALQECSPLSLVACVFESAQLGLELGGVLGHAYPVPFRNKKTRQKEAQFILGYKGMLELARRSGKVSVVHASVIHEKDTFFFQKGTGARLEHLPEWQSDEPGGLIGAYAFAQFTDGTGQFEVMNKREIDAIRARSKAAETGPWVTDYDEMAKKTVFRRLAKWLPCSVEIQKAVSVDELRNLGIMQGEVIDATATEVTPPSPPASMERYVAAQQENDAYVATESPDAAELICPKCNKPADDEGLIDIDGEKMCSNCAPPKEA